MQGGQKWKGKKFSVSHRKHISEAQKKLYKSGKRKIVDGRQTNLVEKARIEQELKLLESKGYHCIPLHKARPDIIAIKDGKIFAFEVEYGRPNVEKYTPDFSSRFDRIVWIVKQKHLKRLITDPLK